jgi:hypothetical protein
MGTTSNSTSAGAAFRRLTWQYVAALREWEGNAAVKEAAGTIGLDCRAYCDRYIGHNFGPLIWTTTGSNWDTGGESLDAGAAYREALRQLGAEEQGR